MFWLLLVMAFEFSPPAGKAGGMLAGAAVADWQNSFVLNPALVMEADRFQTGLVYSRPYGLDHVDWGRICAVLGRERWSGGVSINSLSFADYRESDLQLNLGIEPAARVTAGLGVHLMVRDMGRFGIDAVPAFDLGVNWQTGVLCLGAAGFRLNLPRFGNGDELPLRLVLAGSLRPVETLLLALDVSRAGEEESVAFGMEFCLIPPIDLRIGVGYEPLSYGAGLGVRVGFLQVDYSYRFHPQLKETHILGMQASWL